MDTDLKENTSDMLRPEDSFTERQAMKTWGDEKAKGGAGESHQAQSWYAHLSIIEKKIATIVL